MKHKQKEYCTCGGAGTCTGCTLFVCDICNGAEGSLPTHCPGRRMTEEEEKLVFNGSLDYQNGKWINRVTVDKCKVDSGKYEIWLQMSGELEVYRGGVVWMENPAGSKMLISMMYELLELRKLVACVSFDFDPDKGELGPRCGPEMLNEIKEYAERFGINLSDCI